MSEMVKVEDAFIDDLRDAFQFTTAFSWLWATLAVERIFPTFVLLLAGLMMFYWSLSIHPDKCNLFVGDRGFRWERKR